MEAFFVELKEMKDSIRRLESLTDKYEDKITAINKEMSQIKEENITLKQQVFLLQRKDENTKQTAAQSMESSDGNIIALGKKVESRCSKVEASVENFKDEFSKGMTKMQEDACQLGRHQRVLSVLHVSLQSRKDMETEMKSLKTEVNTLKKAGPWQNQSQSKTEVNTLKKAGPRQSQSQSQRNAPPLPVLSATPGSSGKHPSKKALSRTQANKRLETMNKPTSLVFLDKMPLLYGTPVCVEGFTRIDTACDFMDPVSGVYTVPLQGEYKVDFECYNNVFDKHVSVCLCTDRNDKRINIVPNRLFSFDPVYCHCEQNDKLWLEATGTMKVHDGSLSRIKFLVIKM